MENNRKRACKWIANSIAIRNALIVDDKENDIEHITSRLSTLAILLDEEISEVERGNSRSDAIALILATDFVWQAIRLLGKIKGDDRTWLRSSMPQNEGEYKDDYILNRHKIVEEVIEDAIWVFKLHSKLRHPTNLPEDLRGFMCDPVQQASQQRLLRAAKVVSQILTSVQVRFRSL